MYIVSFKNPFGRERSVKIRAKSAAAAREKIVEQFLCNFDDIVFVAKA